MKETIMEQVQSTQSTRKQSAKGKAVTPAVKAVKPRTMGYAAAIAAGQAICAAAVKAGVEYPGPDNKQRYAARGVCIQALDNLWYDHVSDKARAKMAYSNAEFFKLCGWPE